ncbi:ATP-binding protein [Sporomusa malonica]|uniref:histidine kinase n=1 Tax=Sporomusa malonica TaxID=112901 RepID=A0A1W1ZY52_9FIRM|nr:ATP-binding protein [Sporomusa malonica]SMC53347.1 His Kinase A (phospho-acceptor) domain-containing protein [Sporomusa malonica]
MPSRLCFSDDFAKRMKIVSILIGLAVSLTMPIVYFTVSWQEFHYQALLRSEELAYKIKPTIQDNPDLWYYNVVKFMELADESNVRPELESINIFDREGNLIFKQVINGEAGMTHPFRNPIRYNNEIYGFVEIRESVQQLILGTVKMASIFAILGTAIGVSLYMYSVNIVKLAEKDVLSAEQSKRQAESELARLDRLRLVGEMAAAIGHEVRNPLTTVRGYLQFFLMKKELLSLHSKFQLLIDELDRANSIITEFLSMAHNKAIKTKECNLNSLIEELQPLIQSEALIRGLSVELDLKNIPNISVDAKEIKQLILNITQNGLEAMEYGGCLFIKTDVEKSEIRLLIIDQGAGIGPDLLPKMGTPFFTTKETGTGLGLAVCYSIAQRHQAKIDFESGGRCTTCIVRFPYSLQK